MCWKYDDNGVRHSNHKSIVGKISALWSEVHRVQNAHLLSLSFCLIHYYSNYLCLSLLVHCIVYTCIACVLPECIAIKHTPAPDISTQATTFYATYCSRPTQFTILRPWHFTWNWGSSVKTRSVIFREFLPILFYLWRLSSFQWSEITLLGIYFLTVTMFMT